MASYQIKPFMAALLDLALPEIDGLPLSPSASPLVSEWGSSDCAKATWNRAEVPTFLPVP